MPRSNYLFTSKRLGFRLIEDTDFNALKELDMDPEVRAQFPEGVLTSEQIKERISKNKLSFNEMVLAISPRSILNPANLLAAQVSHLSKEAKSKSDTSC